MDTLRHKGILKKIFIVLLLALGILILIITAIREERLNGMNENISTEIREKEENPYSPETMVGFYMYDIFEANRGSCRGGDWEEEDGFYYYEIFDPYKNENYNMDWSIHLTKMKGCTLLAEEFNEYHESLFEEQRKEMRRVEEEGKLEYREGREDFRYYSRNLRTVDSYYWKDYFTIVDIKNVHMSHGVAVVTANFNLVTGKKYELEDLFCILDYREWLLAKIEEQYPNENYIVERWSECWDRNYLSFLMAPKGLVLIDNFRANVEVIPWEKLYDVLAWEVKQEISE